MTKNNGVLTKPIPTCQETYTYLSGNLWYYKSLSCKGLTNISILWSVDKTYTYLSGNLHLLVRKPTPTCQEAIFYLFINQGLNPVLTNLIRF